MKGIFIQTLGGIFTQELGDFKGINFSFAQVKKLRADINKNKMDDVTTINFRLIARTSKYLIFEEEN